MHWDLDLGANRQKDGTTRFKVWAPNQTSLRLKLGDQILPMEQVERGYFTKNIATEQTRYTYLFNDGQERHDPVSRSLPQGLNGPTEIIDPHAFEWSDAEWKGIPQKDLILYECHVGTFTQEGTFRGVIGKLPYLKELGITCLELMPIAAFSGRCNWGYDGGSLYTPHHLYGGPNHFKELVNACHAHGIAIALDVVYNHFGPEGAYVTTFAPYLTDRYQTPWGMAINYDGPGSDEVKHFMLQNALYWIEEYHIDVLRLDALHSIYDFSPYPFLRQLREKTENRVYLIGENDRNDSRLIRSQSSGGFGFNAWWNEDFHHALHVTLTGEKEGYYCDYQGMEDLKEAMKNGVIYQNKFSIFRNRSHGNSFNGIGPDQLVVFLQNHDQIGNRPFGNRLSTQLSFEIQKTAAMILLLSPYVPLLFMGEEYGEKCPFEYFVDYTNPELMQAVYAGRKKEFHIEEDLPWPDISAFHRSKLSWDLNPGLHNLYKQLIPLRRRISHKKIKSLSSTSEMLIWEYEEVVIYCNLSKTQQGVPLPHSLKLLLHTEQGEFGGKHPPSFEENKMTLPASSGAIFQKG